MRLWMQENNEIAQEGSFPRENEELMAKAAVECLKREGIGTEIADNLAVSVSFVSEEEIRKLNSHFRNSDRVTDVLSFPMMNDVDEIVKTVKFQQDEGLIEGLDGGIPLGDVVICTDMIRKQAEEYGHSQTRELIYLFVHSILHLLGYDHMDEDEKAIMRAKEETVMENIGIGR